MEEENQDLVIDEGVLPAEPPSECAKKCPSIMHIAFQFNMCICMHIEFSVKTKSSKKFDPIRKMPGGRI